MYEDYEDPEGYEKLTLKGTDNKILNPRLNELALIMAGNIHGLQDDADPHYALQIIDGLWLEAEEVSLAVDVLHVAMDHGGYSIVKKKSWGEIIRYHLGRFILRNIEK